MDIFTLGLIASTMLEGMAVVAEIEAMKAENESRQNRGEAQAYPEESFQEKAQHLWALSNQARMQGT